MAKRRGRKPRIDDGTGPGLRAGARQADTFGDFAEDLGRLLGSAESKARGWLDQRKAIADKLAQVRDSADQLLRQLTGGAASMAAAVAGGRGRRGRPPGSRNKAAGAGRKGRRKRPPMSAEARARIADAQRKRWAKQKRTGKKTAGAGEAE